MKKFFIFIPIISICIFLACSKNRKEEVYQAVVSNLEVYKVKTTTISSTKSSKQVTATGMLASNLESKPSFKTGGVIERTFFKEGDRVGQGTLLATLNMSEIKAQVEQAKKGVEKTIRDLNRVKNLYADSVATLEQVQNAQTAYDVSVETLKIAEFNQSYSKVRAPISGVIVKQIVNEGEIVGPGMSVCVIMGTGQSHWVVKASVSDKEWAQIKKGDKAEVKFEAFPDQYLEGTVEKVADIANMGTATLDIEIKLKQRHQKLAAGLIAQIAFLPNQTYLNNKTSIPIEALVSSHDGEAIVFVPVDGKAFKKKIKLDKIEGTHVFVTSGLEGVQEIITAGGVYLQDGDKIEIVK